MLYYVRLCSVPVIELFALTAEPPQHWRSEKAKLPGFQSLSSGGQQNKTHILRRGEEGGREQG